MYNIKPLFIVHHHYQYLSLYHPRKLDFDSSNLIAVIFRNRVGSRTEPESKNLFFIFLYDNEMCENIIKEKSSKIREWQRIDPCVLAFL